MSSMYVGIYGETCAGKSTLGKQLELAMGSRYISFGDLRREEIVHRTTVGLEVERLLDSNCPLPADLGYAIIKDSIGEGLNFISGYPISVDEFDTLSTRSLALGTIVLEVGEQTLKHRFNNRRECPKCYIPGAIGDSCSIHKIPMIERKGVSSDELVTRKRLYQARIDPFLGSSRVKELPRLHLDTSTLTRGDVACQSEKWTRRLLTENGDAS